MKKVILTTLLFIMLLPFIVKADSCDVEKVTIESITMEESTGNASEKSSATVIENNINLDLSMSDVGDSVTYKVDVRNDSEDDMEINKDAFNVSDSEYIKYTLNDENSVLVEANSTKTVFLKIEYKNEVPVSLMGSEGYKEEEDLTISLATKETSIIEEIINPKTGDIRVIVVAIVLVISAFAYLIFSKEKPLTMVIIGMLLIIPVMTYATCEVEFNIKANIEINRIAEFDYGMLVNYKMRLLGGSQDITSFKRSNTLPDNIKTLVSEALNNEGSINVTAEEVNERINNIKSIGANINNLIINNSEGEITYCYSTTYTYGCYDKDNLRNMLLYDEGTGSYLIVNNDSGIYKYLLYDFEHDEIKVLTEEELRTQLYSIMLFEKKIDNSKNILSSNNSDYVIYGWYDSGNINYYCENDKVYLNVDSSNMFGGLIDLETAPGISNVDTSKVRILKAMFVGAGMNAYSTFNLDLSSWDTSNVTDMSGLFSSAGSNAGIWSVGDISHWNTSKVTNMNGMFNNVATNARTFNIDLSNWNTSNVTNMSAMFLGTGNRASSWSIGNLSSWDVSKVTNMNSMFFIAGERASTWNIGDISSWNVSNVMDMSYMFYHTGQRVTSYVLDLSTWNTSKVTNMGSMFEGAGTDSTTWSIGDISNWNTSNVTNMSAMFDSIGYNAESVSLDLSRWDVSNVEIMTCMFRYSGFNASSWSVGDLSNWNTSKVIDMSAMFLGTGNRASSWSIGNLSSWDMSKVSSVRFMFYYFGNNSTTLNDIGVLNLYASDISEMFNISSNIKAIINLYVKPTVISNAFRSSATNVDSSILVNYKSEVTNIDDIIGTKSSGSHVTKGELLD